MEHAPACTIGQVLLLVIYIYYKNIIYIYIYIYIYIVVLAVACLYFLHIHKVDSFDSCIKHYKKQVLCSTI